MAVISLVVIVIKSVKKTMKENQLTITLHFWYF